MGPEKARKAEEEGRSLGKQPQSEEQKGPCCPGRLPDPRPHTSTVPLTSPVPLTRQDCGPNVIRLTSFL